MARLGKLVLPLALLLPLGCSSAPEGPSADDASDGCERDEGEACDACGEDEVGTYACVDEELVCMCKDDVESRDDESDDEAAVQRDATRPTRSPDAGATMVDAALGSDASRPKADGGVQSSDGSAPRNDSDGGSEDEQPASGDDTRPDPSKLPKPTAACPEFREGTVTFKGSPFRIYVGNDGESKLGPLVFYWYATGSSVAEVTRGLSPQIVDEIKSMGGMVAAMERSTGVGQSTGNFVWFVEDYKLADEVLACAIEKKVGIDTSRIHAIGFSAGGLQSSWMSYARNNYMASVVAYSGGLTGLGEGTWVTPVDMTPDPSNVVPAMLVHGREGADWVIMDFAIGSAAMEADIKKKGGFSLDCNHGGGHSIPSGVQTSAWQFMKDHPYKTKPSPYAAGRIPASFPMYCKIP